MLGEFGWELVEARTIEQLWVAEIWLIRSSWSPTDCEVFLSFETDPEGPSNNFSKDWFVRPSRSRPFDWFAEDAPGTDENIHSRGAIPSLSTKKETHLAELFKELADMRNEFVLHSK